MFPLPIRSTCAKHNRTKAQSDTNKYISTINTISCRKHTQLHLIKTKSDTWVQYRNLRYARPIHTHIRHISYTTHWMYDWATDKTMPTFTPKKRKSNITANTYGWIRGRQKRQVNGNNSNENWCVMINICLFGFSFIRFISLSLFWLLVASCLGWRMGKANDFTKLW